MNSTLVIQKTPSANRRWSFNQPVKGIIARKFYHHGGTGRITVGPEHMDWFLGLLARHSGDSDDARALTQIVDILRSGDSIDMWFET